ncbi:MAG TPA: helix-turn-helix domain-containing protein [Nitrospira sp.]|nr:helix-turn-helix domain-containing protein [Nitrospira sp.]
MTATELKSIRATLHLSQQALADRLGVARNTITRWEMGMHPIPTLAANLIATIRRPKK